MSNNYRIKTPLTEGDIRTTAALFEEYAASLPIDLDYQDFAAELAGLPGKYSAPGGALLLAEGSGGFPLGCVGLRPLEEEGCCEMKRLYLLPAARGLGLGRALTMALIEEAKRLGYQSLRLDTLPTMTVAIALYEQMGFERIDPYYRPTPAGTVFMALAL